MKTVEVRRTLPDRLEIDVRVRPPVAVVAYGNGLTIDQEAVILKSGDPSGDLIKIKGVSFFLRTPRPGENIMSRNLGKAIELIEAIRSAGFARWHKVKSLDISDKNNFTVLISGTQIKMGSAGFKQKVKKLGEILDDPKIDLADIGYIDLRFEKPVISPK